MYTLCYTYRFVRRRLETMSNSKMSMILMVRITGMRDRWKINSQVGKTLGWILIPYQCCLPKLHVSSFQVWVQSPFMASFSIWPLLTFLPTIPSIWIPLHGEPCSSLPSLCQSLLHATQSVQGPPLSFLQYFICSFMLAFTTVMSLFKFPIYKKHLGCMRYGTKSFSWINVQLIILVSDFDTSMGGLMTSTSTGSLRVGTQTCISAFSILTEFEEQWLSYSKESCHINTF